MRCAVAYQSKKSDNTLRPGDVIVSNHPAAGGSHLPNVTVITPLSAIITTKSVLFWVASRSPCANQHMSWMHRDENLVG
jgi:5-oxoprolinase (ATP-hydrolysing)